MTVPTKYANHYVPVKYFLSSYRALSDGRVGIRHLEQMLENSTILFSDWKIAWIGTCTILRTAIDLFQIDRKSCINPIIRKELAVEWNEIKANELDHQIFWEFLRKERDSVIHEYEWRTYEAWMKPDGTFRAPNMSVLALALEQDDASPLLLMKSGKYQGRDSLELLKEGADWVEARIFGAIKRAGFDPDEQRGLVNFQPRSVIKPTLLGSMLTGKSEDQPD